MALELCNPDLTNVVEAFHWLSEHPAFFYKGDATLRNEEGFAEALDLYMYRDNDGSTVVMLEVGPWLDPDGWEVGNPTFQDRGVPCHDPNLDSSGITFEAALLELAGRVMAADGDYAQHRFCSHCLQNKPAGPTDPEQEWYCSESCEAHGPVGLRLDQSSGGNTVRWIPPREQFDCDHWVTR